MVRRVRRDKSKSKETVDKKHSLSVQLFVLLRNCGASPNVIGNDFQISANAPQAIQVRTDEDLCNYIARKSMG